MKIGEALKIAVNDRDLASIAAITDRLRFEAGMKYNDVYHFARRNGVTLSFAEWDVLMGEVDDAEVLGR